VRVVDVFAGALAGLLIATVAWPRGAAATLGEAVRDLIDRSATYLAAAARAYMTESSAPMRFHSREWATQAAVRAESVFAQYLTEHPSPEDVRRWTERLSAGNRLWYAADLIAAAPRDGRADADLRAWLDALAADAQLPSI
jgi:uncharacterized membrane protein YccC